MKGLKLKKTSTRLFASLLAALVAMVWLAVPALAAPGAEGGEPLTVGVPADRCPVFYRDPETGELVGIGVDLMRIAAEEAGYSAAFTEIAEPNLKAALDSDAYDVLMPFGSAITSASGLHSVVSENLIQTPFTLVTQGDMVLPELNQLRVGMLSSLGGGAETVRQLFPGIQISFYETMEDCVKALRAGEVDGLLHNSYVWSFVLQKPAYSDLTLHPSAMFSMDFRVGAPDTPEGRAIIERLNSGIAALTDTRCQAIVLDYTSRKLYQYEFTDFLHQYGVILLLGALLVASLVVIVLQRLRSLRQDQAEQVRQLLDQDLLTGALSLNGFRKRAEELLHAHPDVPYMISYSNIRNFKYINDSQGREAGDELLRFWVNKFRKIMTDDEAVGRIEADHITFLRRLQGEEEILKDTKELFEPVQYYFIDKGKEHRVQICSGIYVLTPQDYQHVDVDRMLDYARVAEKRVRDTRKEGFEFYNPDEWEKGKRVSDVVNHLTAAIQAEDIQVWYQPQVDFDTGKIIGAEALCHWDHDKLGRLRPSEFIPTLEETGLIYELDSFVWKKVCQDLQRWNQQGHHRFVSVNLSRSDMLEDRDIAGQFSGLIQTYGLTPDQLRIEITESAYVEKPAVLIHTTEKLRELGFQVEMDDFGSGYSSPNMLKEVPVDRIKLDLHFLTESGDPVKSRIIVHHIVQMVRSLGMGIIAEGVESIDQARFLQSQGCSEMQGYYFYRNLSVQDFERAMAGSEANP